jgi:hypothetical protein
MGAERDAAAERMDQSVHGNASEPPGLSDPLAGDLSVRFHPFGPSRHRCAHAARLSDSVARRTSFIRREFFRIWIDNITPWRSEISRGKEDSMAQTPVDCP